MAEYSVYRGWKRVLNYLKLKLQSVISHPGGCDEPNSSLPKEQYVFLAAESSLYPPQLGFLFRVPHDMQLFKFHT